jgi:copper chaperone CopZ
MSRRRGEFEHRTSIFEGAFRAWSHLGGLDPEELETRPASDLDPLSSPIAQDPRDANETKESKSASEINNPDGSRRRIFPYEPLPRSGLAHPYVQAILSPWLGPDADHDAIQLGLTTLRTWWQHRRKGESGSAIAALGTDKMRGVVEGYTRHFFNLAHCLVVNDKEQPPRTLHGKMKELEKVRNKRNKKRAREDQAGKLAALALNAGIAHGFNPNDPAAQAAAAAQAVAAELPMDLGLSPLERLHAAQRRQLAESGGIHATMPNDINSVPLIPLKGKCIPGKIDLPAVVNAVNHHATQLAHRGGGIGGMPSKVTSGMQEQYGDPNSTPVVFVSHNGDIQLAMAVDGITCAHCVKIVETVLKGCNGNKSPIDGLLDAAADRVLCKVLIKIDKSSNAKRISFEAARNLAMVGYTARPHEMSIANAGADKKVTVDLGALSTAFEVVANTNPRDMFDWAINCTCPDNGILRDDCSRYVLLCNIILIVASL